MTNKQEKTYILVVKIYNEYDEINHQEFWNFDSIEEAEQKEKEIIETAEQKIETWINEL